MPARLVFILWKWKFIKRGNDDDIISIWWSHSGLLIKAIKNSDLIHDADSDIIREPPSALKPQMESAPMENFWVNWKWFFFPFLSTLSVWVPVIVHMLIELTQRFLLMSQNLMFLCVLSLNKLVCRKWASRDDFWMSMAGEKKHVLLHCYRHYIVISFTQSRAKFIADKNSIDNFFMMLTRNELVAIGDSITIPHNYANTPDSP